MNIFCCFSQYFNSNDKQYEKNSDINLFTESDEDENIPESTINDFINFCQKNTITLNKENVLWLHKLAKKFMVPSLIKSTNKYISTHQKDIVIDLLLLSLNDPDDTSNLEYEEIISENLTEHFQDIRLLSFPLPLLHRIVTKYTQKNINSENQSEFIEFLFKCLDKFGREGSVLFEHVDIGGSGGTFLHRLLNEYSEKFDFHFINYEQLRTIYNLESEIIEKAEKLKETEKSTKTGIEVLNLKISELKTENDRLKAAIEEARKNQDTQIQQIQQKQEELKSDNDRLLRTIEEMNTNKDSQIQQIVSAFTQALDEMKEQITQINEKVTQQSSLIGQINGQIEQMRKPRISCQFLGEQNLAGAIARFKDSMTLSAGPSADSVATIMKDDKSVFCKEYPKDDCYIKFDFGQSKRIELLSYFIRSNGQNAVSSAQHPKTWRIESSNDNSQWTLLDRRENDDHLYGQYKQHHFVCQENRNGDETSRYRYIRYLQEDSWWNGHPYYIDIAFFELYGDIFYI